jgi:5-methylcytosine-specific restriction endonuclease McrBC GTP-binding regulatory subunit McrB
LDEMNLARVEHYFSDFLSCLESGEALHLHDDISLEQGESEEKPIPRKLKIPSNLFFTGTVNVDETTYMFSPKVLDRAFTIELNQVDLTRLGSGGDETSKNPIDLKDLPSELRPVTNPNAEDWDRFGDLEDGNLLDLIVKMNDILAEENRHFGYRVANEIARFVTLASEQAGPTSETHWAALDLAILEKVLPKFHGTQQELEEVLLKLFDFTVTGNIPDSTVDRRSIEEMWRMEQGELLRVTQPQIAKASEDEDSGDVSVGETKQDGGGAPLLPRTAAKLYRMLRRLNRQGFTSFIE